MESDLTTVLNQTFDVEFMDMLHMCLFVPFLQQDCPQINSIPKSKDADTKLSYTPNNQYVNNLLALRKKYRDAQEHQKLMMEKQRIKNQEHHQYIKNSIFKIKLKENLKERVQE